MSSKQIATVYINEDERFAIELDETGMLIFLFKEYRSSLAYVEMLKRDRDYRRLDISDDQISSCRDWNSDRRGEVSIPIIYAEQIIASLQKAIKLKIMV